jgi:hypothetical protein
MIWKDSCDRYIGFFDIMGFKNLVYRNNHEYVKKKMYVLHEIVDAINNDKHKNVTEVQNAIKVVIFSDSILFITKNNSPLSLKYLLLASSWFIAKCFEENIPIKGALSAGMITANFEKSIFFGKALIDAYLLQEELQIYGCVLDNHIEKKLKTLKLLNSNKIKKLKIPLKGGSATHLIINWVDPIKKYSVEDIKDELDKFYLSASGITRKYVDNTIDLIEKLKE